MAKIFVSFNIVNPSNCFLVAREKSDPLSEVYRSAVLTTPHSQRNITIDNINPVMHIVQLWTTSDNVTLNALIGSCDIDASIANGVAFEYIQFVVGRGNGAPEYDPVAEQGQYVNPDLDGKDYLVHKEGFGVLKWDIDIQTISGGGFKYINGNLFSEGEGFTVQYSLITSSTTSSSGKSYPEDVVEITGNITFGSTHYNKLIEVNAAGAGSIVTIDIPSLDAVPNGTIFGINTHNGNQRSVTLQLNVGRYCLINNSANGPQQRNSVYIGRGEEVTFIKKGSYLRIVNWDGDYKRIGQRIFCDGLQPINTLPETGGWYVKAEYLRFANWYLADLPAGELGTGTEDVTPNDANKRKFIIGATKFWMPDTRGLFMRATSTDNSVDIQGPRLSGSFQADEVGPHDHNLVVPASATSTTDSGFGKFVGGSSGNEPSNMDLVLTEDNSGDETRPRNVATNVYRII